MTAPVESARTAQVTRLPSWTDLNREWLIAAIGRLRSRIEAETGDGSRRPAMRVDCVEAAAAAGFTPALVHCAKVFGLSSFERELLLLVAGLELDHGLRLAVARLNAAESPRASYGLALGILTEPHWDALSPDSALRAWRMVMPEGGATLTQAFLHIDERILHFIAGVPASDAALAGIASPVRSPTHADDDEIPLFKRIARALAEDGPQGAIVVLSGRRDPAGLRDAAFAVAAQSVRPALWIEARDLPPDPGTLALLATHVDREAMLSAVLPVLCLHGSSPANALGFASRLRGAFVWLGEADPGLAALPQGKRVLRFELVPPKAESTRRALRARWQRHAPSGAAEDTQLIAALDVAATQFHLGPAAIDAIVERLRAATASARAGEAWLAAREAARGGLDTIAQRVVSSTSFEDVVLPPGQAAMLREIARQLRLRERVYEEWGFGAKHQLGQGLVALFTGESGTGKTLAASAIANDVGLDLYRVDLATLVSKYIGETEKNLKRLFDAAEASGAVLLFDEADALFGKRSEVKDSHDRYANIEVAYLLQRVEAYRGLAVLTTNMKSALDRAFMRRIRFVVGFPHPDADAREQIWRKQFPANAPLGKVDFKALAKLNIAGGNIRSIALNAAFKAAGAGTSIDQSTLVAAAHEEFAKLERSLNTGKGGAL